MANVPSTPYVLSGPMSQRLRFFCTSNSWDESDLDNCAQVLESGSLEDVSKYFEGRVSIARFDSISKVADPASQDHEIIMPESGMELVRQSIADIHYGPTKIPVFNYLLQLTILDPSKRSEYVEKIRYLAITAKVPVDSMDLSGNTTLMWAISLKPYWDPEIADFMIAAGAKINHRNRFGCTTAHDIVTFRDHSAAGKRKISVALKYFVDNGGDLEIKDGDGLSARYLLGRVAALASDSRLRSFCKEGEVVARCAKCNAKKHESGQNLLTCGRCKTAKYCSGECQKADWKEHKGGCGKQ